MGNPMTESLPRRPRVLGSPRSVALAKEGVPPEWEPGCGTPRRRRPVGRERQPGATGHVMSGRRHRRHPASSRAIRAIQAASAQAPRRPTPPAPGRGDRHPPRSRARRIPPSSREPSTEPSAPRSPPRMTGTPSEPCAPPRVVALIIRGFAILQGFHRLFWGEYSGSGCYIVVTAGREGS